MGVAAAQRALVDAGLKPGDYDVDRTGVVFGSDYILSGPDEFVDAMASCRDAEKHFDYSQWAEQGIPKITPLWLLKYLPNMPASHIAIYNDLRGPSNSLTMREASANSAIGEAGHLIARGSADKMIAGATGTRVHPLRTLHVVLQEEIATERRRSDQGLQAVRQAPLRHGAGGRSRGDRPGIARIGSGARSQHPGRSRRIRFVGRHGHARSR